MSCFGGDLDLFTLLQLGDVYEALLFRLVLDVLAMLALVFGLYYRRYSDKELVTSAALFNIFVFGVLTVLSAVQFSVTAGFGLFAILALFTLRSEPLSKVELTYFFGSVGISVVCAVQGTSLQLLVMVLVAVLLGAWIFDHPRLLRAVGSAKIHLDFIDVDLLANAESMKVKLSERLGVQVMSFTVTQIDYITEKASLNVHFRHQ